MNWRKLVFALVVTASALSFAGNDGPCQVFAPNDGILCMARPLGNDTGATYSGGWCTYPWIGTSCDCADGLIVIGGGQYSVPGADGTPYVSCCGSGSTYGQTVCGGECCGAPYDCDRESCVSSGFNGCRTQSKEAAWGCDPSSAAPRCNRELDTYAKWKVATTTRCLGTCPSGQAQCGTKDCCALNEVCVAGQCQAAGDGGVDGGTDAGSGDAGTSDGGADGGADGGVLLLPPPDMCDVPLGERESHGSKGGVLGFLVGDPVVIAGDTAYSFDRLEDLNISTPTGRFAFHRTYFSSDEPWRGVTRSIGAPSQGYRLTDVPMPFGSSRQEHRSLRWTHSLFSFVDVRASATGDGGAQWVVRPPVGMQEEFDRCSSAPCWAVPHAGSPGQQNRLFRRSGGGFEYHQADGKLYVYGQVSADAGMYFLSELFTEDGRLIASVNYANPGSCAAVSTAGAPWVDSVEVGGGQLLEFNYGSKSTLNGDGGTECVLTSITTGSGPTTLATYTYEQDKAGLVSKVVTPSFEEDFVYDAGFQVFRKGVALINHTGAIVSASSDPGGAYAFSSPTAGEVYSNGTACSGSR